MARGSQMGISEEQYREYLASLLRGDVWASRTLVQGLLKEDVPLQTLYVDLLQRALYEVGDMWAAGRISVAVEHMASAQTEDMIWLACPMVISTPRSGRKAVISCTVDELHSIGPRMVSDLLEYGGWEAVFLGANTPRDGLLALAEQLKPDLLGLSVTMPSNLPALYETVEQARRQFPNLPILVGGQAFRLAEQIGRPQIPGARYIESFEELPM